jgi:metal-responsive CopG/Arc/MetJ family transcriptional regulator
MEAIQVVLDKQLLRDTDRAARRIKINRSALVRAALRDYLKQLGVRQRERADEEGYDRIPDGEADIVVWERAAKWPED